MASLAHLVRTQFLGLVSLLLVLTGGAAYAATAGKDSVVSRSIKNGAIKTVDLRDRSVTGTKIAPGGVGTDHVADGSLTGADIADGAVRGADVADGSLLGADIADKSITDADVAAGSLGTVAVSNESLRGEDILNASLTGADIEGNSLDGTDINESTLGTVPYADQAGTGRYGFSGSCDPESTAYVACSFLNPVTLARAGRVLVVATVAARTENDSDTMMGSCRLSVDGSPYATSAIDFWAHDEGEVLVTYVIDNASIVAVTDVLSAGNHSIEVQCNQTGGAITYPSARMTTVTLGSG